MWDDSARGLGEKLSMAFHSPTTRGALIKWGLSLSRYRSEPRNNGNSYFKRDHSPGVHEIGDKLATRGGIERRSKQAV